MEKRRFQRIQIGNMTADISDGVGFYTGSVSNLSRSGLRIEDLSKRFDGSSKQFSLVLSGDGHHFRMKVRPRWTRAQSLSKKVGMEIVKAPWGWAEFVINLEPPASSQWTEITM